MTLILTCCKEKKWDILCNQLQQSDFRIPLEGLITYEWHNVLKYPDIKLAQIVFAVNINSAAFTYIYKNKSIIIPEKDVAFYPLCFNMLKEIIQNYLIAHNPSLSASASGIEADKELRHLIGTEIALFVQPVNWEEYYPKVIEQEEERKKRLKERPYRITKKSSNPVLEDKEKHAPE